LGVTKSALRAVEYEVIAGGNGRQIQFALRLEF